MFYQAFGTLMVSPNMWLDMSSLLAQRYRFYYFVYSLEYYWSRFLSVVRFMNGYKHFIIKTFPPQIKTFLFQKCVFVPPSICLSGYLFRNKMLNAFLITLFSLIIKSSSNSNNKTVCCCCCCYYSWFCCSCFVYVWLTN